MAGSERWENGLKHRWEVGLKNEWKVGCMIGREVKVGCMIGREVKADLGPSAFSRVKYEYEYIGDG